MRRRVVLLLASVVLASTVGFATAAGAASVKHLHFEYGPVHINPGQNIIQFSGSEVPKPAQEGWIVGIAPNLLLPDNTVPPVDIIHLHHAVWVNMSRADTTRPGGKQRFFATGEEKTKLELPKPYGYPSHVSDVWRLNYMIHDLVDKPFDVRVTYDIDFVPAPSRTPMTDVVPIWMDVQNGSVYPVFDVHLHSGTNGKYTYPDQAVNPYPGQPKNVWTAPVSGKLVWAGGHLHPGGLYDDLFVDRGGQSAHIFRSDAKYYEPAGPVSWDVSMKVTSNKWNVAVQAGDKLRISTTYDSSQWSWFETMGIMMLWAAPGEVGGTDPFQLSNKQLKGKVTHGHLKENNNHGGGFDPDISDPSTLANGPATSDVTIHNYEYEPGDLDLATQTPTVTAGQSITFTNNDAPPSGYGTWHTITSCRLPCNRSTGVAYPTANAPIEFDSAQLGNDGQPTAGRLTWQTPNNLPDGTYAYFCRVHPFMRGSFRVVP